MIEKIGISSNTEFVCNIPEKNKNLYPQRKSPLLTKCLVGRIFVNKNNKFPKKEYFDFQRSFLPQQIVKIYPKNFQISKLILLLPPPVKKFNFCHSIRPILIASLAYEKEYGEKIPDKIFWSLTPHKKSVWVFIFICFRGGSVIVPFFRPSVSVRPILQTID